LAGRKNSDAFKRDFKRRKTLLQTPKHCVQGTLRP